MIIIKTPREIELMRQAGEVVGEVFLIIKPYIKSGISTFKLSKIIEKYIRSRGGYPTFKGYGGFPEACCISVNDMVIHGIPNEKTILKDGDIVKIDVGVTKNGYVGDACRTFEVGEVTPEAKRLIEVTKESFFEGVKLIKPGVHLGDIQARIQEVIESNGYSVVRDYTGHGVGQVLHEDPYIPNYGKKGTGIILKEGMTLAIEPMVIQGKKDVYVLSDDWGVKTVDHSLAAHYENSLVVTKNGYELLTISKEELNGEG